jgi:AcrR family transcriptional regulator
MKRDSLTKESWIAAGFRALAAQGPKGIQIKGLAAELQATKGSFYWHFKDIAAFQAAMLDRWLDLAVGDILSQVTQEPDPGKRLALLLQEAAASAPEDYGGQRIETAMRAWALADGAVGAQLARIDQMRLQGLGAVLADLGHDDPVLAQVIYGAYVGLDDLQSRQRGDVAGGLQCLLGLLGFEALRAPAETGGPVETLPG